MKPEQAPKTDAATGERHVFISFASSDVELAHRAVDSLERSGIRCWIADRDIEPAASYPAAITDALKRSGAVLLLLTAPANASPHVAREIELAFTSRKPILPVRVAGTLPSADLQYFLSQIQWLDAGAAFDDADLARVAPRLKQLLEEGRGGRHWPLDGWWSARRIAAAVLVAAAVPAFLFWNGRRGGDEPRASDAAAVASDPALAEAVGPRVEVNPKDGRAYAWVPPGRFLMGCSADDPACDEDERPVNAVEIRSGFWLARTEVTEQQVRMAGAAGAGAGANADGDLPAAEVTWAAASSYCESVGGRLPTEAEWEYAARAGTSTRYYGSLPDIAWFADNSEDGRHPVGEKMPNAFGLYDMLGNVSEWVRDRYYNAYDDTSDPAAGVEEPLAGNASGVARGGSWVSDARGVRVSRRLAMPPDAEEPHIGFRCAVDQL